MWTTGRLSGDRILVICQVADAQVTHNENGQASAIWDMVALGKSEAYRNPAIAGKLTLVPGMPGFYEAYAPDIWLGNTGWHGIPCK
jgi:hypothetical protein